MTLSKNASSFMSMFDGAIDELVTKGTKFSVQQMLQRFRLKPVEIEQLKEFVTPKVEELELLLIGADDQLVEGYSNISKATQREMLIAYHAIIETSTKRPRKRKSSVDEDGVIRVPAPTVKPKKEVTKCDAMYVTTPKYGGIRVFIGNVVQTGDHVDADFRGAYRFKKNVDVDQIASMSTREEVEEFMKQGILTKFEPTAAGARIAGVIRTF